MHAVPEVVEGVHPEPERGDDAGEVVEVLDRVHREAGEGLDVDVPMVQRVHEFVNNLHVDQAVGEVEVHAAEDRDGDDPAHGTARQKEEGLRDREGG